MRGKGRGSLYETLICSIMQVKLAIVCNFLTGYLQMLIVKQRTIKGYTHNICW